MRRANKRQLVLFFIVLFFLTGILFWQKLDDHRDSQMKRTSRRGLLSNSRSERSLFQRQGWLVLPDNVTIHVGKSDNKHNYVYVFNSPHLCTSLQNDSGASLLIVVASSVENWERRQAIRDTWGILSLQQALNFRILFLLGQSTSLEQQKSVAEEVHRYGDIVQENFTESFRNLALKSAMGLKWASDYCSNADFTMKTDDDIFIHIPNLLNILRNSPRTEFLLCHANRVRKILRKEFLNGVPLTYKKYQVSEEELPGSFFPPYCAGLGYVVSQDSALALYKATTITPYFFIEDAYITGFCREKISLSLQDHPAFTLKPPISPKEGVCAFRDGRVTTQEIGPQELYELWKEINTQGFFCPKVLGIVNAL